MRNQTTFWDSERMGLAKALELTADSLRAYGERYRHWAIAYSGGKDSTATVTAVVALLDSGRVPPPQSLTVLYADTRMELPPLQQSAMRLMETLRERGIRADVVLPEMDDRFFVYMFGRGVPPPKNRFRWCTPQIKVEPMEKALIELREQSGEKLLMLTGVRIGESAARDQRIALSCGKDGAECGQGWFQETMPESIADTLAPLLHWRVCHVWDWIMGEAPTYGFRCGDIAHIYGLNDEGSAAENGARTGCVGCNLASRDVALDRLLLNSEWSYLEPLKRLKPLYAELIKPQYRLRKNGEVKKDGTPSSNPYRMGPLTMEARQFGLESVLQIQADINSWRGEKPSYNLINLEELSRITELMEANTWPDGWDGAEMTGDALLSVEEEDGGAVPIQITRQGGMQSVLSLAMEDAA